METFKIVLKEIKEENKWGYESKELAQSGEVVARFKFKADDDTIITLSKGDIVLFKDDYPKRFKIDDVEYISTNPSNLICRK